MKTLRRRITIRLSFLGLRQKDLADLLGLHPSVLSRTLRADHPRKKTLDLLSSALDLPVDSLMDGEDSSLLVPHRGVPDPAQNVVEQIRTWIRTR